MTRIEIISGNSRGKYHVVSVYPQGERRIGPAMPRSLARNTARLTAAGYGCPIIDRTQEQSSDNRIPITRFSR